MMNTIRNSLFIFLLVFLSCKKEFISEQELAAFLSDESNGYIQKKDINDINFSLQYRPTDMMVKQAMNNGSNESFQRLRYRYKNYIYLILSISYHDAEITSAIANEKEKFSKLVNNLSFNIDKIATLCSAKGDTIKMVDFVYPRMYGLSQATELMLVYPRDMEMLKRGELNFTLKDLGFSTGSITFAINNDYIINEPSINEDDLE